jgi:hypothetical protein
MPSPDGRSKLWWTVPVASVTLLLLLGLVFGQGEPEQKGTSHDGSGKGYRAAYLLLQEMGYPVARSRRAAEGRVRWVLSPEGSPGDAEVLDAWVRDGGTLVLGDDKGVFAQGLGFEVRVRAVSREAEADAAVGPEGVGELITGPTAVSRLGPAGQTEAPALAGASVAALATPDWPSGITQVLAVRRAEDAWFLQGQEGFVWAWCRDRPFVTVYPHGRGQVWLLNRPAFLTNRFIGQADNGVLVCRLAEATLGDSDGPLEFDEYCHGLRDRPGFFALLLKPPLLWVTLQGFLLVAVLVWYHGVRFGGLRPAATSRRSAEEYLDAVAALLDRRQDHADAYRTARDALRGDLERELGVPHGTPVERLAGEAAARRGVARDRLLRLLSADRPPTGAGPEAFVGALVELEKVRDALFPRRPDPPAV